MISLKILLRLVSSPRTASVHLNSVYILPFANLYLHFSAYSLISVQVDAAFTSLQQGWPTATRVLKTVQKATENSRCFFVGGFFPPEGGVGLVPKYVSILRIPQIIRVWRATVEWYWQEKTEELGEKPVPVPLCPPQTPHGLTRARTRVSAVRGRRLTTWALWVGYHSNVSLSLRHCNVVKL
jgi:hypothetical protein